jgi:hypothetical protein
MDPAVQKEPSNNKGSKFSCQTNGRNPNEFRRTYRGLERPPKEGK